jgi:hypothetical protein
MQRASVTYLFPLPIWVAYFQRENSYLPINPCSLATRMAASRDSTPSLS